MFTPTTITVFYAFCGIVILWMLYRIVRNRSTEPTKSIEQETPEKELTPENVSLLPSVSSTLATPATWKNRQLFSSTNTNGQNEGTTLPRVEAGDVPVMGSDDYVFGSATPALAEMMPESDERRSKTKTELQAAGYYQPHALQNFSAIRYLSILGTLVFFGAALILAPERFEIPSDITRWKRDLSQYLTLVCFEF